MLRRHRHLCVVGVIDPGRCPFDHLRTLSEWGVADVIPHTASEAEIRERLRAAPVKVLRRELEPAWQAIAPNGSPIVSAAIDVVVRGGGADELARALFVSDRTLRRHCEAARLPPARELLAWLRLLLAARQLDHPRRSLQRIAHSLGYAAESCLRRVMLEFLGTHPSVLRKAPGGAFNTAVAAFTQRCASLREGAARGRRA